MSEYIQTKLDQVVKLQKQKTLEIGQISRMQFRTIARVRIPMSEEIRKGLIDQTCKQYDSQIRSIYKEINADRSLQSLPEYECPI